MAASLSLVSRSFYKLPSIDGVTDGSDFLNLVFVRRFVCRDANLIIFMSFIVFFIPFFMFSCENALFCRFLSIFVLFFNLGFGACVSCSIGKK